MDMWTIRSADRLRCPRVAAQHGDCSPSTTCPQGQQQPKRFKIGFTKAVNSCVTSTGQVNLPSTSGGLSQRWPPRLLAGSGQPALAVGTVGEESAVERRSKCFVVADKVVEIPAIPNDLGRIIDRASRQRSRPPTPRGTRRMLTARGIFLTAAAIAAAMICWNPIESRS